MAQLNRRRLNRRMFLSAAAKAAAGGGAALVFGCGGGDGRPSQTSTAGGLSAPLQGGEIVIGRLLNALGLDPHIDQTGLDIVQLIYSRLYTWDSADEVAIFNDFAESVEIPDPLKQEFIFNLRQGVKVHSHPDNPASGAELTSNDCKQSFIRRGSALQADKRLALAIAGTTVADPTALAAALQTPDPYTFSFKLTRRYISAFRELARPEWSIIPAAVIDKSGAWFTSAGTSFGSGPFMLKEFRGTERIALARHPEYFLKPRPWLDRIIFAILSDQAALVSGVESGRLDALTASIGRDEYLELKEDGRFTVSQAPTLVYPVIHLKIQPPFSDVRVRKAIDLALDRDAFIESVWGGEAKYSGPVPWPHERWALPQNELRRAYPYDPGRARALLEEAGFADGFTVTMTLPRGDSAAVFDLDKAASVIAHDLSKVGIDIKLDEMEPGSFTANRLLPGNFEMALFASPPFDEPDRPLAFYHSRGVSGVGNWNDYSDTEIDALIDAQSTELDETKRQQIIHKVQRLIINEHSPQIALPSGYEYHARWAHVHYPYEIAEPPASDAGPWGSDIWTEEA
jgi:peptide/nickel transport system substrate-binding protein